MSRSDWGGGGGPSGRRGRAPIANSDPQVLADLEAIDATLAGEPVDPAHAGLAELALLLADTAPRPTPEFEHEMDARVARHFAPIASAATIRTRRWFLRPSVLGPAFGLAAAAAAAVVVITNQSSTPDQFRQSHPLVFSATGGGASSRATSSGTGSAGSGAVAHAPTTLALPAPSSASSGGGRRIQSAQISLTAPNARIALVSQEIFNVVGLEHGTVANSQVTTATNSNGGSYATFTLSVPTGNLQTAMTRLSQLAHTAVTARTDSSQNVSDQYSSDKRKIADAQALRTSLLKQLQAATTQNATTSIEKQLRDAETQLTNDQTALKKLQRRITNSTISVQVNSGRLPGPTPIQHRHGYLHRALHNALHVLVVAAGVALIAVAVAIPLAIVAALIAWTSLGLRRRRRERALDQS